MEHDSEIFGQNWMAVSGEKILNNHLQALLLFKLDTRLI